MSQSTSPCMPARPSTKAQNRQSAAFVLIGDIWGPKNLKSFLFPPNFLQLLLLLSLIAHKLREVVRTKMSRGNLKQYSQGSAHNGTISKHKFSSSSSISREIFRNFFNPSQIYEKFIATILMANFIAVMND